MKTSQDGLYQAGTPNHPLITDEKWLWHIHMTINGMISEMGTDSDFKWVVETNRPDGRDKETYVRATRQLDNDTTYSIMKAGGGF
ncbi:MAG: hypothetical protein M1814_004092 [Vezdaea aestivalis]|nr:MAG: hypothetical protein M1814_004092 [Vezdaea aestivalis]